MVVLPSGTVTFAFVDVVGSTSAFTDHGEAFVAALGTLHRVIADATEAHAGVVVKTEGDGAFLAFPGADGAVRALVGLQGRVEAAASDARTPEPRLRVRAGAHTGPAVPVAGDYVALPVNIAARVTSAAGAGQALLSTAVVAALDDPGLVAAAGDPLGEYALKDVPGPTALHRVAGGPEPPRAPPYRRTNVSDPLTSFVGRESELAALRDLVRSHRLVTVLGPGGMGKTRITSQLVLDIASSYPAGAWLVELASIAEPEQVLGQVAGAVGSTAATVDELGAELAARGPLLLLVDNCEHVIDAAAKVTAELLDRAPDLSVLATSREALEVEDELVWRIPALGVEDAGCALFAHRYGAASGRAFDDLDRGAVVDLCTALDGSPLAIELASVQARDLPIGELLAIVKEGADPLARARGRGRQSSLDAVVAWSIDRLDVAHREALLVLAQAPGRLTSHEAGLLLAEVADQHATSTTTLLRGLVRVSLLDLDGERYRLLDTIRAAARRALRADPVLRQRARRMLHAATAALVDPDHDFSLYLQDDPQADRLLLLEEAVLDAWQDRTPGLGAVWMTLGIVAVYLPVSARLLAAAQQVLLEVPRASEIGADDAYRVTGAYVVISGEDPHAIGWTLSAAQQFVHAVAAGSPPLVATRSAWMIGAGLLKTSAGAPGAAPLIALAVDLAERSSSALAQVNALNGQAVLCGVAGDLAGALAATERARELAPPDFPDLAILANNHAATLSELGRHDEALALLRSALLDHPVSRDRWALLLTLAEVLTRTGDLADARAAAEQVAAELLEAPDHGPALEFRRDLAQVLRDLDQAGR